MTERSNLNKSMLTTIDRMAKKALRMIAKLLGIAMLLVLGFGAGAIVANEHEVNHAASALRKCNLSQAYAPTFYLRGFTGFRDTFEQAVFEIKEDQRTAFMQEIGHTEGWTVKPVTAEDFRTFSKAFWYKEFPPIPEAMVFDAWFYRETHEPSEWSHVATGSLSSIGTVGYGFEFAVFDMETGMMIFVDQFG